MIASLPRQILTLACLMLTWVASDWVRAEAPDSIDFFENRIRPVLVERCYECHSVDADELGGSLALDSRDGMISGGDSGPAIDPGNSEGSMLISAIRYESSEMPPDGKLPDHVIHDFEQWIAAGAPDPRTGSTRRTTTNAIDLESGRQFWAFQPLAATPPPVQLTTDDRATDDRATDDRKKGMSAGGPIDSFLNERLSSAGIVPNPLADPSLQLRRLAFDLTGLPPSLEMQQRWLEDPSSRNWRRLVDELIASPGFGEHWARHWMDIARYADSNGSDFNATFHEAWRYREYLIRSFATDQPLDRMIRQQIAGDHLPYDSDQERYDNVVATTFLMLGTKMLSERDKEKLVMDVVDDQIDLVGRAFLGMTLGCARCHDHKFDPVPSADYYALAGIFKSTVTLRGESQKYVSTWNRVPLPTSDQHRRDVETYEKDVKTLEAEIKRAEKRLKEIESGTEDAIPGIVVDDAQAEKTGNWKSSVYFKHFVGEGYVHDDNSGKGDASIRFRTRLPKGGAYEVRISHSPGSNRASSVPITITTADGETNVTSDQRAVQIEPMWSSLGVFQLVADVDTVVTISNEGTSGYVIADAIQFLAQDDSGNPVRSEAEAAAAAEKTKEAKERVDSLKKRLANLKQSAPDPLPEAMAPADESTDKIADAAIHIRGETRNFGPVVARGFLQVCGPGDASIRSPEGSGRLELADWLTDPDHPLVARVFVNRVWMYLMGEGLVRTVDNFGTQGQLPTHPELLDYLANEFVRGGWHLQSLVRDIVMTDAYRRSSDFATAAETADPENRLLWRAHRRRLTAESVRDAMIEVSGQLDRRRRVDPMKGRGVLVSSNNSDSSASFDDIASPCRSVYLPLVRGYLPELMKGLDMADPDLLVGRRPTTNVPAQALVLINSPEVNDWASITAQRILDEMNGFDDRLDFAFRLLLQRPANDGELAIATQFFAGRESSPDAWHQYVAAMMAGTPFRLLD